MIGLWLVLGQKLSTLNCSGSLWLLKNSSQRVFSRCHSHSCKRAHARWPKFPILALLPVLKHVTELLSRPLTSPIAIYNTLTMAYYSLQRYFHSVAIVIPSDDWRGVLIGQVLESFVALCSSEDRNNVDPKVPHSKVNPFFLA